MRKIIRITFIILCVILLNITSSFAIINGEVIQEHVFPSVVKVHSERGTCTGTFVSHNTLITAAHCVTDVNLQILQFVFIKQKNHKAFYSDTYRNIKSLKILIPNDYDPFLIFDGLMSIDQNDLAVVIFPDYTSKHQLPLSQNIPSGHQKELH